MRQTVRFAFLAIITITFLWSRAAVALDGRILNSQRTVHYDTPPHFITTPRPPTQLPDGSVRFTLNWSDAAQHQIESWAGGCAVFENPVSLDGYTGVVVDLEASSSGVFEIKLEAMEYSNGQKNFERQRIKQGRHPYTLSLSGISPSLSSNFQKLCVGGVGAAMPPGAGSVTFVIRATNLIRGSGATQAGVAVEMPPGAGSATPAIQATSLNRGVGTATVASSSETNLEDTKERTRTKDGAARSPEPSSSGWLTTVLAIIVPVGSILCWFLFHSRPRWSVESDWPTQQLIFTNRSELYLRISLRERGRRWSKAVEVDPREVRRISIPQDERDPKASQDILLRIWYTATHSSFPIRLYTTGRHRFE